MSTTNETDRVVKIDWDQGMAVNTMASGEKVTWSGGYGAVEAMAAKHGLKEQPPVDGVKTLTWS